MSLDYYLNQIIAKYKVNETGAKAQVNAIYPVIQRWAGNYLMEAIYSGSIAKGTAISLSTDADLFISLSSITPSTLSEIYNTLNNALTQNGYQTKKQNVSIRVYVGGYKIDFVPGKRQTQYGYDHSIYKNKSSTWTKTNVKVHVNRVSGSNRLKEIKLAKIWRELNKIDFPSFYLELAVIDCLTWSSYYNLSNNFWKVLGFFADGFIRRRYVDPANTNNVISDDLTYAEKLIVKSTAQKSRSKGDWSEIVW